jgi:hypothetical protein
MGGVLLRWSRRCPISGRQKRLIGSSRLRAGKDTIAASGSIAELARDGHVEQYFSV